MKFTPRHFNPANTDGAAVDANGAVTAGSGAHPGDVYVYAPKVILAVNIALATGRPLLVSGEPGSGKTTLARNVAKILDAWFFKQTVTSRTKAVDLLWTFDTLRRLSDAQAEEDLPDPRAYVEPGILWWAFAPESAALRGTEGALPRVTKAKNPGQPPVKAKSTDAVVLLDEVDKADPDVPNDLLEPFDVSQFTVTETGDEIVRTRKNVLLILTTNGERELPPAFLRRCVTLPLVDEPTEEWLVNIATQRLSADPEGPPDLASEVTRMRSVAGEVIKWRQTALDAGVRRPGTAEFLDAYQVCRELNIDSGSPAWQQVALSVLWKQEKAPARVPE